MGSVKHITCLLLFGYLSVTAGQETCPYQECQCAAELITCNSLGLTKIPLLNATITGYKMLQMEKNNITEIQAGSLPSNLVNIDMLKNPILTIDDDAFINSQNTLQSLSFSEASFTRIPDALLHLPALTSFTISDTWIQDWNVDVMKNMGLTLATLSLVNVSLHTWPTWLLYFSNLTALNMDTNYISDIHDNALDMLANSLTSLSLTNNNFTSVPRAISKLTSLNSLLLDNNRIVNITWLPQSGSMTKITLSGNTFSDAQGLSNALRPYAQSLTILDITENSLSEIPDLSYLSNMYYLVLVYNQISNITSGAISPTVTFLALDNNLLPAVPLIYSTLPSIKSIQMTYNVLTELKATDIPVWINDIELSYNLITELTDTSFPENSSLLVLILIGNPLSTISQNAFKNIPHLQTLNLQNTKLTRLPMDLAILTSVTFFRIDGNDNLVCTCAEKSLGPWLLERLILYNANCGETDLVTFFTTLSQLCP